MDETADDDDDETRPTPSELPPAVGPTRQFPAPTPPADSSAGADPDDSEDDFLMGRSDGGIRVQQNMLGWVLVAVGLLAGAVGCLLILVAVLFWQGIL